MSNSAFDISDYVYDKIQELVIGVTVSSDRRKLDMRCPICGDSVHSKKEKACHYYVNTDSVFCFRCSYSASGVQFLADIQMIDVPMVYSEYFAENRDIEASMQRANLRKVKRREDISKSGVTKSKHSRIEPKDEWVDPPEAVTTLIKNRLIDSAPFKPRNWSFYFDTISNRLVIPWMYNGDMIYYQTRKVYKSDKLPKYLFPTEINRPVFNLDMVDDDYDYIFVLEGAFDTIWVKNGISVGSINFTQYQLDLLSRVQCTPVFMPDNQHMDRASYDKTLSIIKKEPNRPVFIWERSMKDKDVNSYVMNNDGHNPFSDYEYLKSRVFNGLRAQLELKK